jgi:excisionase family DNA binding protein
MEEKLYLTIKEAAAYVGIGISAMRDYVNSSDPPPFMRLGNKYLLQKSALAPYFESKQTVKARKHG